MATPQSELNTSLTPATPADASPVAAPVAATSDTGDTSVQSSATAVASAPDAATTPVDAGSSATPAFQLPDDDSDLTGQESQQHVQGILQLRQYAREQSQQLNDLKPLETLRELGAPDVVKQYVDLGRAFFTPVTRDGQPVYDDETGLQEITAAPAIEMLESAAPGYVDNLLVDILNSKLPDGTERVNQIFRWYGLDPARYEDYKNIDRLLAQTNGAVSEDELARIPEAYQNAYKTLPQSTRDDLQIMNPATRENYLRGHQAELERQGREASATQQAETAQQRRNMEVQQQVRSAQDQYLVQVRKEEFTQLTNDLAGWKPSADEPTNDLHRGLVLGTIAALLDPELRVAAEPALKALGVTLDSTFDDAVVNFMNESARFKAYEFYQSTMEARDALSLANTARQQLRAKLSSIATQMVKKLDGSRATPPPSPARPAVPAGSPASPSGGTQPAHVGFSDEWALQKARELGILR